MLGSLPCIHISIDLSWPPSIFWFDDHSRKWPLHFHTWGEPKSPANRDLDVYKVWVFNKYLRADATKVLVNKLNRAIGDLSIYSANFYYAITVSGRQASSVEIKLTIVLEKVLA